MAKSASPRNSPYSRNRDDSESLSSHTALFSAPLKHDNSGTTTQRSHRLGRWATRIKVIQPPQFRLSPYQLGL
jgi:hypothetical protein